MRVRKLLALTLAMILVLGTFTFALGDGILHDGNDQEVLDSYIQHDGSIDTILTPDNYYVKDEDGKGTDINIGLGNGYSVDLDYNEDNTMVTWTLNTPTNPLYDIEIEFINVKASDYYLEYIDGLDEGSQTLESVSKDGGGYYEISHVVIAYEFAEMPKGSITVTKDVTNIDNDPKGFNFTVTGPDNYEEIFTLTENSDPIVLDELLYGTYTITEDNDSDYILDELKTVIVDKDNLTHSVNFENTLKTYEMSIEKDANLSSVQVGEVITYSITVTNEGNQPLTGITLTDPIVELTETFNLAVDDEETFIVTKQAMTAGQIINVASAADDMAGTVTASAAVLVTENPPDTGILTIEKEVWIDGVENTDNDTVFTFTVDGKTVTSSAVTAGQIELTVGTYTVTETNYGDFGPDSVTQQAVVTTEGTIVTFVNRYTTPVEPVSSMTISKTADGNIFEVGDTIEYTVTVVNDGDTTLTNIVVLDEMTGLGENIDSLSPGETEVFVNTYVALESDIGTLTNTAIAVDDMAGTEEATVEVEVEAVPQGSPESITINKTADDYSVYLNENVTYTITVTNNGNVDLENVWVTDEMFNFEEMIDLLEVGESETFTFTTSFDTIGNKINTAIAEYGSVETEDYMMVDDIATVVVSERPLVESSMTIDKVADGNFYEVGDTIEYTVTVENDGDTNLTNIVVLDAMTGLGETIDSLSPGETEVFITTYVALEADIGTLTNTATAVDDMAGSEEASVEVEVEAVPQGNPEIYEMTINKTADDYSVYLNENVTYSIRVTNSGNVDLENVWVTDEMFNFEEMINLLEVGESETYTFTTSFDTTGNKVNTATAEYGIETVDYMKVDDSVTVDVNRRSTSTRTTSTDTYRMTIDKESDGTFYEVGDTIEYTITVENTGNRTLTNIEVIDEMTGLDETIDSLSPGETEEFVTTYVAQAADIGTLINTATAEDNMAGTEEESVNVEVEGVPLGVPGTYEITIDKTAIVDGGSIFFGDMVEFRIVVRNTGEETVTNILVQDQMVNFEAVINELEPGESKEFTVKIAAPKVPGPFVNRATASSTETGTVEDEDIVFVEEPTPLAVPDTGVAPGDIFFGLGVLVSGLGVLLTKKNSNEL